MTHIFLHLLIIGHISNLAYFCLGRWGPLGSSKNWYPPTRLYNVITRRSQYSLANTLTFSLVIKYTILCFISTGNHSWIFLSCG
jgi:hypothetical protein